MRAERWIQHELQLTNPLYFAAWDSVTHTWRIRKWRSIHPLNHRIRNWQFASLPIMTVGETMLDRRAIEAVREGLWNSVHAKMILQKIDKDNARQYESADVEDELLARELAKSIWHHYREPTIFLNG